MNAVGTASHVLIVDDHAGAAELLSEVLHLSVSSRMTTDIGHDGAEGVRLAIAHRPDIALLDIDMPVMNGIDAAFAIRNAFPKPPPMLVAITGNSIWQNDSKAMQAFDLILIKPLDLDRLVALVESM